ncbi:unnamed protein product [Cuscuta epithymum]|uniref:Heat shock protein 90 n=1 Tax=Cuscuta epithymum TaxID=186058 RepID=A0AAV0D3I6_9ASTE|nr:unnamed protein product [Cuscuta epithymum]
MEEVEVEVEDHGDAKMYEFHPDIKRIFSWISNTPGFFSDKDSDKFLYELIMTRYQELDKRLYKSLTDKNELLQQHYRIQGSSLFICIIPDKANNRLIITDSGIGMTKDDLVKMGTMATSGTKKFVKALENGIDIHDICQPLGVGIYSSYLVSEKVIVTTKHNNDHDPYVWESQAGSSFTVTNDPDGDWDWDPLHGDLLPMGSGTKIALYLKEPHLHYLEESRLKDLIKKHSDQFISHPIFLSIEIEKTIMEYSDDEDEEVEKTDEEGKVDEEKHENKKKKKKIKEVWREWCLVNEQKPIWIRKPEDITQEEYALFYKSLNTNKWEENLAVKHFSLEAGLLKFKALLFVPKRAPSDSFDAKKVNNIKLYVRRVLIMESCEELIPQYLSFVEGVVDCEDLPLNICGETLKENRIIDWMVIRKNLVNKCLELFSEIAKDKEYYTIFYEAFSKNLKLGMHEDSQNRTKLAELLRYPSTKSRDELTSLKEYVTRMKEGQNYIYYNIKGGKSEKAAKRLKNKGYEVLLMVEAIDEYSIGQLKEFEGKKLICAAKEGLKLEESEEELKKNEELKAKFEGLCQVMKDLLGDKVEKVVVTDRVMDHACCLVTPQCGWAANMERNEKLYPSSKPTMEISPEESIIQELRQEASALKELIVMVFKTAQ